MQVWCSLYSYFGLEVLSPCVPCPTPAGGAGPEPGGVLPAEGGAAWHGQDWLGRQVTRSCGSGSLGGVKRKQTNETPATLDFAGSAATRLSSTSGWRPGGRKTRPGWDSLTLCLSLAVSMSPFRSLCVPLSDPVSLSLSPSHCLHVTVGTS